MLHRFAVPDAGVRGHSAQDVRAVLAYLRRSGVDLVSADELVAEEMADEASPPKRRARVAFTVDDGYFDFGASGVDAFAAFDCPVTLFVVPGIMESGAWFWWDQVEWAFVHSARTQLAVELGDSMWSATWSDAGQRRDAMHAFIERLKTLPDAQRRRVVADLSALLQVAVPERAPNTHRVLDWNELRALEARGVRVGPHTMTHPVLARCADDTAAYEIGESVNRVWREMSNPSRVFCYPNGRVGDFGAREVSLLQATPMQSAVAAEPGPSTPRELPVSAWRWQVPRFVFESTVGMTARVLFL